ncbi:hypothetical protein CEW92_04070 [Bacillaceae bacterium SAS-127]|nr:hypothetical protein CEW92_04070 [Bacillaceae bacterium SAS-127]
MLKDLVRKFTKVVEEHPRILLDNYELKEGLYVKLSLHDPLAIETLVIDKKDQTVTENQRLLRWFRQVDSLSSVLNDDMNKCVDIPKKKIHNTNFLSLFVKKDYLFGKDDKQEIGEAREHFLSFLNENIPKSDNRLFELYPITAKKKDERQQQEAQREIYFTESYPELMKYLSSEDRKAHQQKVLRFWENHFDTVIENVRELVSEYKVSNYIKLFFDVEIENYDKEYELYILPRIFNVNTFNRLIDDEIVGLPAYDVSMNAKKPFFELKTMKTTVPTRTALEEAISIKQLYQWLQRQGKFKEITLPFHEIFGSGTGDEKARNVAKGAYYLSLDKNGSIQYFDNTPFEPRENWMLTIDNILNIQEKQNDSLITKSYPVLVGKGEVRKLINQLFFGNYMPNNLLDTEAPKPKENIFTVEMISVYVMNRQALFDFLVKDTDKTIRPFLQKYSQQLIENQLLKTTKGLNFRKVADAFLLRLALLKEINDREGMELADQIKEVYSSLKEKLATRGELIACENDEEFFFLAGQVGYYLLSQSEVAKINKNFGIAEPIIKARNPQVLKNKIADLFDTYKHAINFEYVAFKNALSMVQGYETSAKLEGKNKNMLLAGLLANNIFYQKAENQTNK